MKLPNFSALQIGADADSGAGSSTGWRKMKSKRGLEPAWRKTCSIDFVIENPHASKMWELDGMRALSDLTKETPKDPNADALIKAFSTSYCHYGSAVKKNTKFLTTLMQAQIKPLCSKDNPCAQMRAKGSHAKTVENTCPEEKNSIPAPLIDAFFNAWIKKAGECRYGPKQLAPDRFLVVDVFRGYGSVTAQARKRNLDVRSNDIVKQGPRSGHYNFDMSKTPLKELLIFAVGAVFGSDALSNPDELPFADMLSRNGIALLIWLSPPCCTYSTSSGNTHRDTGKLDPKTPLAQKHDAMNNKLVDELFDLALTPPCARAGAGTSSAHS